MKTTTAIPVFQVSNVESALKHYTGIFGFSEDFRFGDYAGIKLGDVRLHLSGHSVHERPVGGGTAYILCDEVDDYCAKIKKQGAIVKSDPKDYPYGMRDFMAVDPDGNHIAFGCEAKKHLTEANGPMSEPRPLSRVSRRPQTTGFNARF